MTPIHDRTAAKPYASDIEYVTALGAAVKARAYHLGARIEAHRDAEDEGEPLSIVEVGDNPKVARLGAIEQRLWAEIDARRKATRDAGRTLGLDALCAEHDLDEVERQILILTAVPCCGLDLYETLGKIGQFSFAIMSVTPEMISIFCDLDLAGRLRLRDQLSPEGKLVSTGLIEFEAYGAERVQDFWSGGVSLTELAFDRIVGRVAEDDGLCPCCGQAAEPENRG